MENIKKVAIVGGVHGNELTGAYLVKKWQKNPEIFKKQSLDISVFLGNPKACEINRRYVDQDLNRSFSKRVLEDHSLPEYEANRAKVLKELISGHSFLIDLHTTTANMGMTLVLSKKDPYSERVAAILAEKFDDIKILRWLSNDEGDFINTLTPHGFTIEAGPIPQGVLRADIFQRCEEIVYETLKIISNDINQYETKETVVYDIVKTVDYPRTAAGEIEAIIHPSLQDRDYKALNSGDPIFVTFDGKVIPYEGETFYPVFINEAAYYEKGIAFCLCEKNLI
ncbi:aspartoacylase [Nitrosophilus alvini]|uniref:aspartoacylase n=1 Tax=Nitrosophilus alvini TaxID=2714855 RepID=UPI00190CEA47|nr:aspartoacylase [Nitrosophilus alvini]